ncbi:MAG: hypothetical protein IPK83_20890 [Planctomycetes bacterium]|nr:hypothetical protein [Planctomycetota bacterium]
MGPNRAEAQWRQQVIHLQEGWNSIFLEIDPSPERADDLFTHPAIRSVWGFSADSLTAGVPNCPNPSNPEPGCPLPDEHHWQTWVQPGDPASFLNSLRVIRGGRAYLIRCDSPTTLNLVGIPSAGKTEWRAGLNFVGFHVGYDGAKFTSYLQASPVHQNSVAYHQDSQGQWNLLPNLANARVAPGTGYWATASGTSDYSGPVEIDDSTLRGVDYGRLMTDHALRIKNLNPQAAEVNIRYVPSEPPPGGPNLAGDLPLSWLDYGAGDNVNSVYQWHPLDAVTVPLAAAGEVDASHTLRMAVVRAGLPNALVGPDSTGSQYQGLVQVTTPVGYRRYFPVSGQRGAASGLWVGDVAVNEVSYVLADGGTGLPRPTAQEFSFRIILHDSGAVVKLLTEVTLMADPAPDPDRHVLITPDIRDTTEGQNYFATLVPATLQGDQLFSPRISTAAFSFDDDLVLTGNIGSPLSGITTIASTDRLNPFRHKYHPDHDGDNVGEVFDVTRDFVMTFSLTAPPDFVGSGYGSTVWAGIWDETLTGLHADAIHVRGTFRIYQISTIALLNETPP